MALVALSGLITRRARAVLRVTSFSPLIWSRRRRRHRRRRRCFDIYAKENARQRAREARNSAAGQHKNGPRNPVFESSEPTLAPIRDEPPSPKAEQYNKRATDRQILIFQALTEQDSFCFLEILHEQSTFTFASKL